MWIDFWTGVQFPSPPPKIDRFRPVDFLSIAKTMVYYHAVGVYLITKGVYHKPLTVFSFAMMIYNSFGIGDMQGDNLDDIHSLAVIYVKVRIHTKMGKYIFFVAHSHKLVVFSYILLTANYRFLWLSYN